MPSDESRSKKPQPGVGEITINSSDFAEYLKKFPSDFNFSVPLMASGGSVTNSSALFASLSSTDQAKVHSLEAEIQKLRDELARKAQHLKTTETDAAEYKKNIEEFKNTFEQLENNRKRQFLLDRVNPDAASILLSSDDLFDKFRSSETHPIFVVSVDIRRSTELMLKARKPQDFANFITELCTVLMEVVRLNHGVVDKFTGDGILCFFPEFFSGPDAGYYALATADSCHASFQRHYREHRKSFQSVLSDIGLGIGIDYGQCHFVQVAGELTVVGVPVVYACRFGGAPAGDTLLNQPAYEVISDRHGSAVHLTETYIDIKHEGRLIAYAAKLSRNEYEPKQPAWKTTKESRDGKGLPGVEAQPKKELVDEQKKLK